MAKPIGQSLWRVMEKPLQILRAHRKRARELAEAAAVPVGEDDNHAPVRKRAKHEEIILGEPEPGTDVTQLHMRPIVAGPAMLVGHTLPVRPAEVPALERASRQRRRTRGEKLTCQLADCAREAVRCGLSECESCYQRERHSVRKHTVGQRGFCVTPLCLRKAFNGVHCRKCRTAAPRSTPRRRRSHRVERLPWR